MKLKFILITFFSPSSTFHLPKKDTHKSLQISIIKTSFCHSAASCFTLSSSCSRFSFNVNSFNCFLFQIHHRAHYRWIYIELECQDQISVNVRVLVKLVGHLPPAGYTARPRESGTGWTRSEKGEKVDGKGKALSIHLNLSHQPSINPAFYHRHNIP